jgi:competence protein ComGB
MMPKYTSKWKRKEKGMFLFHIGQLLEQGYDLGTAIDLVGIHQKYEIREKVTGILNSLREGMPIHQILLEYHFPNNVVGFLFFAEQHGNLSFAFKESGKLLVKQSEIIKEFIKLIRYPVFLCIVTVIVFFFILRRLVPQFQNLYHSLDLELPLVTKVFLVMLQNAPIFLLFILISIIFLYLLIFLKLKRCTPLDKMKYYLRFPILKTILSIFITHYFSIQLSHLLKGGLSIFESLTLFENQSYFKFFQQEAAEMKKGLSEGVSFAALLENNPLFASQLSMVISHGLSSGQLSSELTEYCSFLFNSFEEKIKLYFSIIQPVLFSFIGLTIFAMFISILLPMFHLLNSL